MCWLCEILHTAVARGHDELRESLYCVALFMPTYSTISYESSPGSPRICERRLFYFNFDSSEMMYLSDGIVIPRS